MTRPLGLAALLLVLVALPTPAAAFIGPYTGVGTGLVDRYRHLDNQQPEPDRVYSDATDVYRGRFTYSFRIDAFGNISGTGNGVYQSATWRLDGKNGTHGTFGCDVPINTTEYAVRVTGRADGGRMDVRFALDGARETNDDHPCGAEYTGFASDNTHLADSLELVQPPDGLAIEQERPAIAPLRKLVTTGDDSDRRVILHEWSITIAAPPTSQDVGDDATPGTATRPGAAGAGGAICTIQGTARADRLRGTPGNDVICGYGGGDVIDGGGGQDLVYGGPGGDRITGGAGLDVLYGNAGRDSFGARDRKRDRLDGGSGRDSARVDRGRDRVRRVERVR